MTQHADEDRHQENLRRLNDALEREAISEVYALVRELHPADVALLLESLPEGERDIVWSQLDPVSVAEVLAEADDAVRASHMRHMAPQALAAVAQEVDPDRRWEFPSQCAERWRVTPVTRGCCWVWD